MKTAFIGLMALAMITGCSKADKTPEQNKNYAMLIQGNWVITGETMTIYDASNKVLQTSPVEEAVGIKWVLKDGMITSDTGDDNQGIESGTYVLNTKVDPPTIKVTSSEVDKEEVPETLLLNITTLDNAHMVLEQSQDISLPTGTQLQDADHATMKIEFQRD